MSFLVELSYHKRLGRLYIMLNNYAHLTTPDFEQKIFGIFSEMLVNSNAFNRLSKRDKEFIRKRLENYERGLRKSLEVYTRLRPNRD